MGTSKLCSCSACRRHVKESAATCPFCGEAFEPGAFACTEPSARVRAAAVVGAALVLGGCTASSSSASYGGVCIGSCYEPPVDSGRDLADATVNEGGEQDDAADASTVLDATSDASAAPDASADAPSGPPDAGADGATD